MAKRYFQDVWVAKAYAKKVGGMTHVLSSKFTKPRHMKSNYVVRWEKK